MTTPPSAPWAHESMALDAQKLVFVAVAIVTAAAVVSLVVKFVIPTLTTSFGWQHGRSIPVVGQFFCLENPVVEGEGLSQRLWRTVLETSMLGEWNADDDDSKDAKAASENWKRRAEEIVTKEIMNLDEYRILVCVVRPEKENAEKLHITGTVQKVQGPLVGDWSPPSMDEMTVIKRLTDQLYESLSTPVETGSLAKECCCFVCLKTTDGVEQVRHGIQQFFLDELLVKNSAMPQRSARVSVGVPVCSERCVSALIEDFQKTTRTDVKRIGEQEEEDGSHLEGPVETEAVESNE